MEETGYRTTLLHASSLLHEISATAALLRRARNALILFPEIIGADRFFASIRDMGDRACILHSDMAAGKRSAAIEGILSGRHDIVIGTRTALAAPVRKPELIIVMHEQSGTYKLEDGIRFNIRDCAIMRGFLEKIPVLLTSSAPSMESWANALTGKYHLRDMRSGMPPPKIRTVDMRFSKKVRPYLSASVTDAVRSSLRKEEKVVFVINRRGHSTMVHCEECGNTDRCAGCGIPLVLHKDGNTMQCHYCGSGTAVPEVCGKCGNPRLELLGAGTQKLEEDVRELFGAGTVRFDRDKTGRKSVVREILDRGDAGAARIVVATKIVSRLLGGTGRFGLAAFLNPDISLNIPDFRAREKAYQEIMAIRDLLKPSGEMLLQTRNPQDSLFRFLRDNDYASFAAEELLMRKTLGFPPYVKMMDVVISGNGNLPEKAVHLIRLSSGEIEILGPIEKKTKKGKTEHSILIRHPQRTVLHAAARSLRDRLGKTKGAEIRVDVDPY
jgi:primosomal protein N' (replication factor Y)